MVASGMRLLRKPGERGSDTGVIGPAVVADENNPAKLFSQRQEFQKDTGRILIVGDPVCDLELSDSVMRKRSGDLLNR